MEPRAAPRNRGVIVRSRSDQPPATYFLVRMAQRRLRAKTDPLAEVRLGGQIDNRASRKSWMVVSTYEQEPKWDPGCMKGLVYQQESAPRCGMHWQIFVEFDQKIRAKEVVQALDYPVLAKGEEATDNVEGHKNRVSCVCSFGQVEQAASYCSSSEYCRSCHAGNSPWFGKECKEGCDQRVAKTILVEPKKFGDFAPTVPIKKKHEWAIECIKAGWSMKEIVDEQPAYAAYASRFLDRAFMIYAPKRNWAPKVYWLWGPAGTDKSRMAQAVKEGAYIKPPDTKWFDGYDGQDVVILNDLRKGTFTFNYLLELLDRYPFLVEVKGGYRQFVARVVIITCSKSHAELWAQIAGCENEHLGQLTRRITKEVQLPLSLFEKRTLVREMRLGVQKPMEVGEDELYGRWDGTGEVPEVEG